MTSDTLTMTDWIETQQQHFELVLINNLPTSDSHLDRAIHYVTCSGGKHLRPLLVYASGLSLNATIDHLDPIAVAVELIHCYSLVHDDLPAMDDDDMRRGKLSCHKAFDEATAILVGDALQTLAFQILSHATDLPNQIHIIQILTKACGRTGMIGGQSLDMLGSHHTTNIDELELIHKLKTGALFCAALQMGALASDNCNQHRLEQLEQLAHHFGLAFQIRDDILDIESTSDTLGKTTGKDAAQAKATYPALIGIKESKQRFLHHKNEALALAKQISTANYFENIIQSLNF